MPTFRRARSGMTERAIQSVRSQTFTSWELVIIDDGSTDGTEQIVASHVTADPRVTGVRYERNTGLPARLINAELHRAQGEYLAFMFDDDFWYRHALSSLVSALDADQSWGMAYGNVRFPYRDQAGVTHNDRILGAEPGEFDRTRLEQGNYIANVGVMIRRSVLDRAGTFDPNILVRRLCDWDLWLRISRHAQIGHVDKLVGKAEGLLTADSLGYTAPMDYELVRAYMATDRDAMLRPDVVGGYAEDALAAFGDAPDADVTARAGRMFRDFYRQVGREEDAARWDEKGRGRSGDGERLKT